MGKKRSLNAMFPLAGLDRKGAYRQQAPYSTVDCLNVRSQGTLEGRDRGGSRPGLVQSHITDIGANPRLLVPMSLALGDNFTTFTDSFGGLSLSAAWTQASWASASPSIFPGSLVSIDTDTASGAVVADAIAIDATEAYTVEAFLTPYLGAWHGSYKLYLRMDNTTPAYLTEGVEIALTQTGTDGAWSATMTSYLAATPTVTDSDTGTLSAVQSGWLTVTVTGDALVVYWGGAAILSGTVDTHAGLRVGFGLDCTVAGGVSLMNVFRTQYFATSVLGGTRTLLVASAAGDLFYEAVYGQLTQVTTTLTLRDDVKLTAAQSGQDLYIADFGDLRDTGTDGTITGSVLDDVGAQDWTTLGIDAQDDVVVLTNVGGATVAGNYAIDSIAAGALTLTSAPGNGTCTYRIERGPKVYDPSAGTLVQYVATAGNVPVGCPLISRYLDRIVMSGADIAPHAFFMSRQGSPLDFDYSQTDDQRAVAGTVGEAGVPGEPIIAQIHHSDDYLIFGCLTSLWKMSGDPAYGGSIGVLSNTVGIIGPSAWCFGPAGELIFLSMTGLYVLKAGGESYPIELSQNLPEEFQNIDVTSHDVMLEYDSHDNGVNIFLTPASSNSKIHWWFDWESKTFWPMALTATHEPTAACSMVATGTEESATILGGRDGKLRRFSKLAVNDTGTAFESYVYIGPIPLAQDSMVGAIMDMDGVMALESGDVTWTVHPGLTYESVASADAADTGTWSAGLNKAVRPACRGQAFALKLTGTANVGWAFEQATMQTREAGKRRPQ